ncbi:MAG: hypothetical protein HFH86_02800 [Bacilli bacterium]|jgi:lysozyme|nr:hypothetical protein [Bacilli bacterium]
MKHGIDVSSYQRTIDWEKAKEYIDFAIIRCGYGNNIPSQDDEQYHRNISECNRLNIPAGTYLFSYATDIGMAQSEVEHTLRLIKNYQFEYPIFLDVETREQLALPTDKLVEIVKYYCEKIEEAGYYVGIYASLNTLNTKLNSNELNRYDKWVAEWGKDFNYKGSSGLWQHTDNASVSGINTRVDGDIAFYNYPKIIRDKGLNHLKPIPKPDPIELKYHVGDVLYLNGAVYKTEEAKEEIKEYKNQCVQIEKVNTSKKVAAPYYTNLNGYVKEENLSSEILTTPTICDKIITFLKRVFKRSES